MKKKSKPILSDKDNEIVAALEEFRDAIQNGGAFKTSSVKIVETPDGPMTLREEGTITFCAEIRHPGTKKDQS